METIQKKIHAMAETLARRLAPRQIILFGSRARGDAHADSDIDFLIVMKNGTHRRKTAIEAYQILGTQGISKDIVVVTEEDVQKFGSLPGSVIGPALEHGTVVYDRAA